MKVYKLIISLILMMFIGLGLFISLDGYNNIVKKEEAVKSSWAQIESNIQRKADLLPNIVKIVKKYASHEKEVFSNITALRSGSNKNTVNGLSKYNKNIDNTIMKIFAVSERYPELQSSEHFLELQAQFEGSENRINISRMNYNGAVKLYNSYIKLIPQKFIASFMQKKEKEYFTTDSKNDFEVNL